MKTETTYQKLKEAYKKLSTPQERFEDLVDRLEELVEMLDPQELKGMDGIDGVDGIDGRHGKDADPSIIAKMVLKMIKMPRDGKDATVDYEIVTKALMGHIKGQKKLDISVFQLKDWEKIYRPPGNVIGVNTGPGGGGGSGNVVSNEVVAGSGTSWNLSQVPVAGSVKLYANGQRLIPGGVDYSILGTAITTVLSWTSGTLLADYNV